MAKAAKVRSPQGAKLLKCRSRESDDLFWEASWGSRPSVGGAKLLKWRLAAEGAKLLKSGAALILRTPGCRPHTRATHSVNHSAQRPGYVPASALFHLYLRLEEHIDTYDATGDCHRELSGTRA